MHAYTQIYTKSGSEKPTTDGQCDIKMQEATVRAQPGDARSSVVWSWQLNGHGRAGRQLDRVVPRGETSETPNPILQRRQPDLVVIPHRGGVCEENLWLFGEHCQPFVHPRSNIESRQNPLTNFWCCGDLREQPRASRSATLCVQTGLKSTSTSSLLQALVCGSRE